MNKKANPLNRTNSEQSLYKKCYPWIVISLCASFLFYKYILQVFPSVMTTQLMQVLHVDGAGLGVLTASYFYTYLIAQLFIAPLMDRYSPRLLSTLALGISALGAFCFAMSHGLFSAAFARGLIGVGAAFATVSYMKLAVIWFKPRQFAFVGGLLATAAMMGSIVGQTPLAFLVEHQGWQMSLIDCAVLGVVLMVAFYVIVRDKNPDQPEATHNDQGGHAKWKELVDVLKHKHNWYLMLYSGLAFCPLSIFGGLWGNPFLEEAYHLNILQAASLTSCLFLGLALGAPILGLISDRLGKRYEIMVFGLLLSVVCLITVLYAPTLPYGVLGLALFLLGFGTGAFMLCFAVGRELNSAWVAATVVAVINSGDAIFGSFTEPLIGKILDLGWTGQIVKGVHYFNLHSYHLALAILPLYLLLAFFFLSRLKKPCMAKQQDEISH